MKRLLVFLSGCLCLVTAVVLMRTFAFRSQQITPPPFEPLSIDAGQAAQRLAKSITFKTISVPIPWEWRGDAFTAFHAYLAEAFPAAHAALEREVIADFSLLYTWRGSDATLPPVVFLAHQDVVPVDKGSEQAWDVPPFDGVIRDGFVWGRGAIDDKCSVTALLEAVEALLAADFHPKRTIYLAFGHDEELGGPNGAGNIARTLEARGVKAWFTLDEGLAVVEGVFPGLATPLAMIGIAEKGYISVVLEAESDGGHSSTPPPQTSIGMLARAIARLEDHPLPARLAGPAQLLFEHAGPELPFPLRAVMGNLWLFGGAVKYIFSQSNATNAALRTTTAPTIFQAGTKDNVLPIKASATVNFRILPGDTADTVLEHVRKVVDDPRVTIGMGDAHDVVDPSPVSAVDSDAYRAIALSLRQVYPDAPVAPFMTLGGTDSKHYYAVSENQYRIQPFTFEDADIKRIHGTNERIAVDNYARGIQAYIQIMRNAAG